MTQGKCGLCKAIFSKAAMARHLRVCREKHAPNSSRGPLKGRQISIFHVMAEGLYAPEYWMHFEVPAAASLADVDRFLREIWLECCGHLMSLVK